MIIFTLKKLQKPVWLCLIFILFSCVTPSVRETWQPVENTAISPVSSILEESEEAEESKAVEQPKQPEEPEELEEAEQLEILEALETLEEPEETERTPVPEYIMGDGLVQSEDLAAFLLNFNPGVEMEFVVDLALIYADETAIEGVNHDVAFAQMCLETGFLRFGGLVTPDMNNFCGLGSIGGDQKGLIFPDPRTGVRAHIQHLKAYATDTPLNQELVDPRYKYVRLGSSPAITGLAGTWAADLLYAEKITAILERLYSFAFGDVNENVENLENLEN